MDKALEQFVRDRAHGRCEYRHKLQSSLLFKFPIDHIIARQHGGTEAAENLALCCGRCNGHKGPNLAGIDPDTGALTRLFHPRLDLWTEHFRFERAMLIGLTAEGRTTVHVLNMNNELDTAARLAILNAEHPFK